MNCPKCNNPKIKMKIIDRTGGFEVIEQECEKCGHVKIKYVDQQGSYQITKRR